MMLSPTALSERGLRRAQAVSDFSGTLCSSGSASLDVADAILQRFNDADPGNDTLNQGEGMAIVARHCVVKAATALGSVSLGSFGTGDIVEGSFALTLTTRAGNDLVWTLKYTGFSYTPYGGTAFAPLDATLVFGNVGGVDTYVLDIPGTRLLSAPRISQVGNTVTVTGGSLRTAVPAAAGSGYADYAYAGWVMDSLSLSASAGSVSLAGADGNQARVSAGASAYTVRFTVGGVVSNFTVAR